MIGLVDWLDLDWIDLVCLIGLVFGWDCVIGFGLGLG